MHKLIIKAALLTKLLLFTFLLAAQPPAGYYSTATGTGHTLKTQLFNIINGHTEVTYHSIWTHFQSTDVKSNGKVWDMYSDIPGNPPYEYSFVSDQCDEASAPNENHCYNREHSWPRSWVGGDLPPMHTDLYHVYPTDAWVNALRLNYPYGIVTNPTTTTENGSKLGPNTYPGYAGTVFEPIDEYKGDFARTYFYMVTRYEDLVDTWAGNSQVSAILDGTSFPAFETWFLNMLGEWHVNDPVSQKEIDRNNAVYAIQGNRNPFIDHPEFVYNVWGVGQLLEEEPAGHATNFSAHTITLNWTDALGPNLPEAYLIRMSDQGFDHIAAPEDGTPVADDFWNKNVAYGVQSAVFGMLTPGTVYYFKIYSYRGTGVDIDYKTGGQVQQVSLVAH